MNKETLASMLHGREYCSEITREEHFAAKKDRLVVVFGASDDLVCLAGFISDELGARDGTIIPIDKDGLVTNECEECDCPYYQAKVDVATKIVVRWQNDYPTWYYETKIPHATFDIVEDDTVFCRGIVFSMDDLKERSNV
jgi:hypothetical protein